MNISLVSPNRHGFLKRGVFLAILVYVYAGCRPGDKSHKTWEMYKADAASTSHSGLRQINRGNVENLAPAWTFRPDDAPKGSRFGRSECNPVVVDGVMYVVSARHRVYAIDAGSGRKIWSFDPFDGGRGGGTNRGVTYWEDGNDARILFTAGSNLFALDARTGTPIPRFGENGKVDLNAGLRNDTAAASVTATSPGMVYQDLLILGSRVSELYGAQPGSVRAYNIRTGKLEWTFHTIPQPGEPGYETWPKGAWKYAGGVNDWGGMSLDKKRGMVFLALGSPSPNFYGGNRKGKNLYGNCVVALEAKTGKYIWHFQTVHHDLWDYDLPAPPNLVTLRKDGNKTDAVAQVSKSGFVFVLDRETGRPLFPIEEREVPASDVPGEDAWPTQPFPLKPKPFSRQFVTENDLSSFSSGMHDTLVRQFHSFRYEGLFTPPSARGTLNLPGTVGGAEWGGAAYDPVTGVLYVKGNNSPEVARLQKVERDRKSGRQSPYNMGKALYMQYCSGCHGKDRNGNEPDYPPLAGLKSRMTKKEVLQRIRQGSGKMPAFSSVLGGHEEEIIAYLFGIKSGPSPGETTDMKTKVASVDTTIRYLNVSAYHPYRTPNGDPSIRPPWGTLSAINLNTGEYEWKVPVGNDPVLQKEGAPPTGTISSTGPIVTAGGVVFIASGGDHKFSAYDKSTGKLLWEYTLPSVGSSTPCTYLNGGVQYVALSVAGNENEPGGYIISFALSGRIN